MSELPSLPERDERYATLVSKATRLYEEGADYNRFIEEFSREELVTLWDICTQTLDCPFDDEVYDAINVKYEYFYKSQSGELLNTSIIESWHKKLTGDDLLTPGSTFGDKASECAWWAIAAYLVFEDEPHEAEERDRVLDIYMGFAVNSDPAVGVVSHNLDKLPRIVVENLTVRGGES